MTKGKKKKKNTVQRQTILPDGERTREGLHALEKKKGTLLVRDRRYGIPEPTARVQRPSTLHTASPLCGQKKTKQQTPFS